MCSGSSVYIRIGKAGRPMSAGGSRVLAAIPANSPVIKSNPFSSRGILPPGEATVGRGRPSLRSGQALSPPKNMPGGGPGPLDVARDKQARPT